MASRIMHAAIGELVCSKVKLDKNRFMIGNLAPDVPSEVKNGKDISHFALGIDRVKEAGRYIDHEKFLDKYRLRLNDSFFLGYYCHLLSDELWHADVYKKYITTQTIDRDGTLLQAYYSDFRLLNTKLISYYRLSCDIKIVKDIMLDEINIDSLEQAIMQFYDDFSMLNNSYKEHLCLIKFRDVINYIDKSAKLAAAKIEGIIESTRRSYLEDN